MYDGELIKKLRVNKKLTQSQLAEGICSKTSLVGIETNSVKKMSFVTVGILRKQKICIIWF